MLRLRAVLASALLVLPACGKLPTGEAPPELNLPAVTPVGSVQPGLPGPPPTTQPPGASPSPGSPTPAPTPTPTSSATPGASCRLPAMPECGGPEGPPGVYGCCQRTEAGQFAGQVDAAIDQLRAQRPDLFNGNRVLDETAYVQGVARLLEQRFGLCARQGEPDDEVAVKANNSYNEQYDILFSNGTVRMQGIVVACRPARF
jgi:hypothetical protein